VCFLCVGTPARFTRDAKQFLTFLLIRSLDRTKRTGFVASSIAWSHFYWHLPVGPPEVHRWISKTVNTAARTVAFDSNGWDNSTTCLKNFCVPGILGTAVLNYVFRLYMSSVSRSQQTLKNCATRTAESGQVKIARNSQRSSAVLVAWSRAIRRGVAWTPSVALRHTVAATESHYRQGLYIFCRNVEINK
jgi:hypothetical protein